jgi:hypothetical protein
MIEVAAVLVSPLKPVLAQDFGEAIKKYGVVGADRIVSDRKLEKQGYECATDNAHAAKIASAVHHWNFSSFGADAIQAEPSVPLAMRGSAFASAPPRERDRTGMATAQSQLCLLWLSPHMPPVSDQRNANPLFRKLYNPGIVKSKDVEFAGTVISFRFFHSANSI